MLLKGKRVIVTGGVTGIGRATVIACVRQGAKVVSFSTASLNEDRVKDTMAEANNLGTGQAIHIQADISDKTVVDNAFEKAVAWMGGLDALVNCALTKVEKPAETITKDDIFECLAVTTFGTVFTNQAAFRHMKNTGGSIVNYTSYVSIGGQNMEAGYGLAKGAVNGWSHVIAREWGPYLIRVNLVAPVVESRGYRQNFYDKLTPEMQKQIDQKMAEVIILGGKMGNEADAANVNLFLVSDLSSYMTGQIFYVDGGISFSR